MTTVIAVGLREIPALVVLALLAIAGLLWLWMVIFGETITVTPMPPKPSAGTATAVADDSTDGLTAH